MRRGRTLIPAVDRIASKCAYQDRGHTSLCLIYSGSKDRRGYGMIGVGTKNEGTLRTRRVHRVTYEYFNGPVPEGMELDHLCRQHDCCEPTHLEAVTHAENCRRGVLGSVAKARAAAVTHCPRGHEYTPENTYVGTQENGRYPVRQCRTCAREWTRARRSRTGIASAVIAAALFFPVLSQAKPSPVRLAPPVACTMDNRLDIFVDEDAILWECTCEALSSGFMCHWQVIGGTDPVNTRKRIKHHKRVRLVVRYALPAVTR